MRQMKYLLLVCLSFSTLGVLGQTPDQLKSWLPPVDGWTISEDVEVFNPDNLFDRINGAAPLFIENNFKEMTSLEYTKGDDYITIQAYRHATPQDAFGMYSSERTPELSFYPIGGEAQGDDTSFFFFAGNMYIKMWAQSEESGDVLQTIAKGLAEKIDPNAAYPAVLKLFPAQGKEPYSEGYITANYMGHTFLNQVYFAKYTKGDKPYQLFLLIVPTVEEAKDVLDKYYKFARQETEIKEGMQVINDRYNGDIPVIWQGKYILGIFSENGDATDFKEILNTVTLN